MYVGNHQNCTLREVRTPHGFIVIKLVRKFILINRIYLSEDVTKVCVRERERERDRDRKIGSIRC